MPSLKIQVHIKGFIFRPAKQFYYKAPTHPKETSVTCLPVTNKFFRIFKITNSSIKHVYTK